MTGRLERRYQRLLWAYPVGYRAERGDELIDTALAAAPPGATRPSAREAWSLLVGGLRARAGSDRQRTARQIWADGLHLSVILLLAYAVNVAISDVLLWHDVQPAGYLNSATLTSWAPVGLATAALLAAVRGRLRLGLLLTTVALAFVVLSGALGGRHYGSTLEFEADLGPLVLRYHLDFLVSWTPWDLLIAAVLLALLLTRLREPRRVRSVAWLLAVPVMVLALPNLAGWGLPPVVKSLTLAGLFVGAAIVGFVDARVPIAVGGLAVVEIPRIASFAPGVTGVEFHLLGLLGLLGIVVVLAAALFASGHAAARRQARL